MSKIDELPDGTLEQVRGISKAIWNSRYRLEVAYRIAETPGGRVFAHGLARECHLTDKTVGEELRRLQGANLLIPVDTVDPGQKRRYLDRADSCYWEWTTAFVEEIVEHAARQPARPRTLRPAS
jgi:hypothetical protein